MNFGPPDTATRAAVGCTFEPITMTPLATSPWTKSLTSLRARCIRSSPGTGALLWTSVTICDTSDWTRDSRPSRRLYGMRLTALARSPWSRLIVLTMVRELVERLLDQAVGLAERLLGQDRRAVDELRPTRQGDPAFQLVVCGDERRFFHGCSSEKMCWSTGCSSSLDHRVGQSAAMVRGRTSFPHPGTSSVASGRGFPTIFLERFTVGLRGPARSASE